MSKEELEQNNSENSVESNVNTVSQDSPGATLRDAREKLGLTQDDVASRLHLRLGSVVAVESDQLEEGVSVTFTKGYVRLYAKLVNLEAKPLLDAYDRLHSNETQPAKLHSFSRRVSREAQDSRWNFVSGIIVTLVLGSIIYWWVDREDLFAGSGQKVKDALESIVGESEQAADSEASSSDTQAQTLGNEDDGLQLQDGSQITDTEFEPTQMISEGIAVDEPAPQTISVSQQNELVESAVNSTNDSSTSETTDTENARVTPEPVKPESEENIETTKRNSADIVEGRYTGEGYLVNEDGSVDVVFTFTDDCWVSVRDATGRRIAVGVKKKGRVMTVSGIPPVRVVLGLSSAVEIDFGGQRVDMSQFAEIESPKFELPLKSE